jgi:glycerol kinase
MRVRELRVDGGAARNDFLMQFQADILGARIVRPRDTASTALGAALLAGLGAGMWSSTKGLVPPPDRVFLPRMPRREAEALYAGWKRAVARVL